MPADPKIAAIVGSGFIGRAWAIAFARAGCSVRLYDAQGTAGPAALAFIDSVLDDLAANDLLLELDGGRSPDAHFDGDRSWSSARRS